MLEQWTSAQRRTRNEDGEEEYRERGIELPRPIPVRLLYHTAHVEDGRVVIVRDAYGWDAAVARALGLPVGPSRAGARPLQRSRPLMSQPGPVARATLVAAPRSA